MNFISKLTIRSPQRANLTFIEELFNYVNIHNKWFTNHMIGIIIIVVCKFYQQIICD